MVRYSKQSQRRNVSPKRPSPPAKKTGPKAQALPMGFKEHLNAVAGAPATAYFIPVQTKKI